MQEHALNPAYATALGSMLTGVLLSSIPKSGEQGLGYGEIDGSGAVNLVVVTQLQPLASSEFVEYPNRWFARLV